jgi:hypothetical protein
MENLFRNYSGTRRRGKPPRNPARLLICFFRTKPRPTRAPYLFNISSAFSRLCTGVIFPRGRAIPTEPTDHGAPVLNALAMALRLLYPDQTKWRATGRFLRITSARGFLGRPLLTKRFGCSRPSPTSTRTNLPHSPWFVAFSLPPLG